MNWYTGSSAGERWRITLITRNSVLRREEEPRLEMLRLRISIWPDWYGGASMPAKATSAGVKAAHVADLRHELGAESRANTEHPHHNRVLRQRCRQGLHFVSERGQCGRNGPELGHRLLYQKFGSIGSGHDAEMPTGEGVDVKRLILAEVVTVFLAPLLILGCKRPFGESADTLTVRESSYKVYPLLAAVRPGRAGKQSVRV